jgi:hypothetical protein
MRDLNEDMDALHKGAEAAKLYYDKQRFRHAHNAYEIRHEVQNLFHALSTHCRCQCQAPHQANLRMKRHQDVSDLSLETCFDLLMSHKSSSCEMTFRVFRKR